MLLLSSNCVSALLGSRNARGLPGFADVTISACPLRLCALQGFLIGAPHTDETLKAGQICRVHCFTSVAVSSACMPPLLK